MREDAPPRVSVVIPVYDAGPYLAECLDSAVGQDIGEGELEIVAVDDGSTDGSGDVLDAYAARHPGLRVIHQENSGWPGRPRNVGLRECRGRYVFFADADDVLAPEAMRRLADFADENASDVVVPRTVGIGGREVSEAPFGATQVDADIAPLFSTLLAMKLFRRDFLEREGLRFPEGRVRLEDGMLVVRAYVRARRVSVLADRDYYFLRRRGDGGNLSSSLGDPRTYLSDVSKVIDAVREESGDAGLVDAAAADLYARKALRHLGPEWVLDMRPSRLRAWFEATREMAATRVPASAERLLPVNLRLRSRVVRDGDVRALKALAELERDGVQPRASVRDGTVEIRLRGRVLDVGSDVGLDAGASAVRVHRRRVDVSGCARVDGVRMRQLTLTLSAGAGDVEVEGRPVAGGPWWTFDARVPATPGDEPRDLVVRAGARGPAVLLASVAAPPRGGGPLARANRLSRRPAVSPARDAVVGVVKGTPLTRRVYRALRGRR